MKLLLHPLPVRLIHWLLAATVILLTASGFLLSEPSSFLATVSVRQIHGMAGVTLFFLFPAHLLYYFLTGRTGEVAFGRQDLTNLPSFLRYALFLRRGHPNYGRYNPGQKMLFFSWALAFAAAIALSVPLLLPDQTSGLQRALGGLQLIRSLKYLIACHFLASIPFHIYLALTESPAKMQAMITGYVNKE